jgi:hypothetical protein
MESKLVQLKTDFNNIINIRTKVKGIFDFLQLRIDKLKGLYAEFIKTSTTQMFIFGLDSFHFQSKLIDIEHDDMKRLFLAISNRMYCEYFKLYKIIVEYILSNKNDKTLDHIKINNYPVYKDLEPYKEYDFEVIQDIHENILHLVGVLISTLNNKENEFLLHKNKQKTGLNIDNFITTFNYSINVMKEKIIMFITYIEFFHKMHSKYLKRFSNRIQLMYSHINHDIQFDDDLKKTSGSGSGSSISQKKSEDSNIDTDSDNGNFDLLLGEQEGTRSRTNSSISSGNQHPAISPRFIQKNIKLKTLDHSLSHDDLNTIFSTIEQSCDSIIKEEAIQEPNEETLQEPKEEAIQEANEEPTEIPNFKENKNVTLYLLEPSD